MADTEILLESGTNEIEIMQFTIFGELYGINVAKVREIMIYLTKQRFPFWKKSDILISKCLQNSV